MRDSKGGLRVDSAGATTRRAFTGLLGVGATVAKQWWDRGLRWGGSPWRFCTWWRLWCAQRGACGRSAVHCATDAASPPHTPAPATNNQFPAIVPLLLLLLLLLLAEASRMQMRQLPAGCLTAGRRSP